MKVCVGLSGGVDSSVAALLLKREGHDVFAMFMQNWHDADATLHGDCEWEEDRFVAEMVARKIGIPFFFVDLSKEYRQRVVEYMFNEYSAGRTPNPDILCNREIKFDAFLEAAKGLGADMVATGHYCRREPLLDDSGEQVIIDGQPQWRLLEGVDPNKDQSYFLCQLTQDQLGKALFPIGGLTKPEVREIARLADLPSADKKDSQGICFVGKVDLPTFLKQKLEPREGEVVEVFDSFYKDNSQYTFVKDTLGGLLATPGEPRMITAFASEDSGGAGFNNMPVIDTSANSSIDGQRGDQRLASQRFAPYPGKCSARRIAAPAPISTSSIPDQCSDRRIAAPVNTFDESKLAALSGEDWMKLSEPIDYSVIKFETETYRSGKRHIRKTRYKENPWGAVVGKHDGAQFYTIGQRKGLGIGGHKDSVFVLATDVESNIIYVGEGHGHKGLSRSCVRITPRDIHWIRRDLEMRDGEIRRYRVRVRYRQPLQDAWLAKRPEGLFILFDMPQRGLSSGQFAAWYSSEGETLGSGVY